MSSIRTSLQNWPFEGRLLHCGVLRVMGRLTYRDVRSQRGCTTWRSLRLRPCNPIRLHADARAALEAVWGGRACPVSPLRARDLAPWRRLELVFRRLRAEQVADKVVPAASRCVTARLAVMHVVLVGEQE